MKEKYGPLMLTDLPQPPAGKVGWPWTKASQPSSKYMSDGSEWPRVSVITPSYNQGQFLEETIRSVLLQGYPNLEYIIIDGGSTDDSVEIIKQYEPYLAYWVSELDKGQAHAVNKGLKVSTGSILGWINSDDLYTADTLKKVTRLLHKSSAYSLAHGNRILINERSQVTGFSLLPPFDPEVTQYVICSETTLWKRSAMVQAGLLKEELQFAMDLEFFGRLYSYGKFLKIDDYLGYFRCHKLNKSSTIPEIKQEEASREWKHLFKSEYGIRLKPIGKLTVLKELAAHPYSLGFPYVSYKFSVFFHR